MTRWRIHVDLVVVSATGGNQVRDYIINYLVDKPVTIVDQPTIRRLVRGIQRVQARLRFGGNRADADAMRDDIVQAWNGQHASRILTGSRISVHRCPHDDQEPYLCTADEPQAFYAELVKE